MTHLRLAVETQYMAIRPIVEKVMRRPLLPQSSTGCIQNEMEEISMMMAVGRAAL